MRRLPVYLLVDCSESMAGEAIASAQQGLAAMVGALRGNPYALESVSLCVITFDAQARVAAPLAELGDFVLPTLTIKSGTALGAALRLLSVQIKTEVHRTTIDAKGDYRPLVFLLTDGQPTDAWQEAAKQLKSVKPRVANIYAIGCGDEVDFRVLNEITDICYCLHEVTGEIMGKFFVWMTASIQSMSQGADSPISLEKSPVGARGGLELLDPDNLPVASEIPLQVFLYSRCAKTRKFYLLRYVFDQENRVYFAKAAHPLPDDFFTDEGEKKSPSISSDLLFGGVPCPFCGDVNSGRCGNCGQIFCNSDPLPPQVECPSCRHVLRADGVGGAFTVGRAQG